MDTKEPTQCASPLDVSVRTQMHPDNARPTSTAGLPAAGAATCLEAPRAYFSKQTNVKPGSSNHHPHHPYLSRLASVINAWAETKQ